MNWKTTSIVSLGLSYFFAQLINTAANVQYSTDSDKRAIMNRDTNTVQKLEDAVNGINLADEVAKRERKEIDEQTKKWKFENNFEGRLKTIHQDAVNELNEFKQSIDYFDRKQGIIDEAENAIDIFKESIDYDYEIGNLEDDIDTAKSIFKKRSKLYDLAKDDEDISETADELKKAEKEKMDAAIKKAQDKIEEINSKVQNEKSKIERKKQSDLRELDKELASVKSRIEKAENEASEIVRKEFNLASEDIRNAVYKKRTDKEVKALDSRQEFVSYLEEQKRIDEHNALDLYESSSRSERWANWFKTNGWPKWLVGTIGVLPIIPATYLMVCYGKFVYQTLKAM